MLPRHLASLSELPHCSNKLPFTSKFWLFLKQMCKLSWWFGASKINALQKVIFSFFLSRKSKDKFNRNSHKLTPGNEVQTPDRIYALPHTLVSQFSCIKISLTRYNPETSYIFFFPSVVTVEISFSYLLVLIHSQMDMQVSD